MMRLTEKEDLLGKDIGGREFFCFDSIGSTNDYMKALMKEIPRRAVVTAEKQTAGRGRTGRSFYSDGGIYFSVSYPRSDSPNVSFITLAAGLAVRESLKELYGLETLIKWPNDIYAGGKKLCGILTEGVASDGLNVIVGIGINICQTDFPDDIKDRAVSLRQLGICTDGYDFAADVINRLDKYVYGMNVLGHPEKIIGGIKKYSFTLDKTVVYMGKEYTACDIDTDGALTVTDGSSVLRLISGEVNIADKSSAHDYDKNSFTEVLP